MNRKLLYFACTATQANKQRISQAFSREWQQACDGLEPHDFTIAMVNDEDRPRSGKLRLVFTAPDGKQIPAEEVSFLLAPLGAESYTVSMKTPETAGKYSLQAIASPADDTNEPTISQRDVIFQLANPSPPALP